MNRNQAGSAYRSISDSMDVQSAPRVRHGRISDGDGSRAPGLDESAYSRVASDSYLQSSAIKSARKRRRNRKIIAAASAALVVAVIAVGVAFAYVSGLSNKLSSGLDESLYSALVQTEAPEDPFYVLLLGTDKSEARANGGQYGGSFRSDSIMLCRIDPKAKNAAIVSIPRDTMVDIEGYETQKINAARALGGPTLAVKTVSKVAGVPISHYAELDFEGFAGIVDRIGGVEVNVPIDIDDDMAGGHLSAGEQTLNGEQALILCRSRHSYDDYGPGDLYRAANQRMVLSAIANKILSSDVATISGTVPSLADCVTTDMGVDDIISIATSLRGMNSDEDIYTAIMPTSSEYINGGWYEIMDDVEWRAMILRMDEGKAPSKKGSVDKATGTVLASSGDEENVEKVSGRVDTNATIAIRNGNGTDGVGNDAQKALEKLGYEERNFDIDNADDFEYEETLVIYRDDDQKPYAKSMVDAFGLGKAVQDEGDYLFETDFLVIIGSDWKI